MVLLTIGFPYEGLMKPLFLRGYVMGGGWLAITDVCKYPVVWFQKTILDASLKG